MIAFIYFIFNSSQNINSIEVQLYHFIVSATEAAGKITEAGNFRGVNEQSQSAFEASAAFILWVVALEAFCYATKNLNGNSEMPCRICPYEVSQVKLNVNMYQLCDYCL